MDPPPSGTYLPALEDDMRYHLLGRTGLYVSEFCMGTMTFGGQGATWSQIGTLQVDEASALIKRAFDAGVNFFDTANVYGPMQSEIITGESLKRLGLPRDQCIIATKATGIMDETPNGRGQSRYHLMNQIDASLKRLQLDHVDLYQLHAIDPLTPIEEALETMNDIVRSGRARYVGVSNWAAWHIMKGLGICERRGFARIQSVQAYYTLAGRDLEREIVPLAQDQGTGIMVWSPLAGGLLSGKFSRDGKGPEGARRTTFDFPVVDKDRAFRCVDAMRPIAERLHASVAQVALAWLLSRPGVTTVILGAKNTAQLDDNLKAASLKLSDEDLKALDEVSRLPREYPGWMLETQGKYRAKPPFKEPPVG
jgi:aryl-alcohol dehydrogenase-like predicted oxidoreductase